MNQKERNQSIVQDIETKQRNKKEAKTVRSRRITAARCLLEARETEQTDLVRSAFAQRRHDSRQPRNIFAICVSRRGDSRRRLAVPTGSVGQNKAKTRTVGDGPKGKYRSDQTRPDNDGPVETGVVSLGGGERQDNHEGWREEEEEEEEEREKPEAKTQANKRGERVFLGFAVHSA